MARITFEEVSHSYRAKPETAEDFVLSDMNFTWDDGGAYALLGPSGCGKTTLLNLTSGLLRPTRGQIQFDGDDVTGLKPGERNIAQVFQFPVVYDTMTVADNLAFPLRNRGVPEPQVSKKVTEIAEMMGLETLLRLRAAGLTAEQKQKISMGRGLVRDDVAAILFDEPLTVIDPHMKWQVRRKLKEIHKQFGHTLVYVTHDQNEALTFADKVVVMSDGEIVQVGTPQELFEQPAHRFVGYFIGSPGMNFLPCSLVADGLGIDGTEIVLGDVWAARAREKPDSKLELGIRPEFLDVVGEDSGDSVPVQILKVENLGNFQLITVGLGPHAMMVRVPEDRPVPDGFGHMRFDPAMTKLYTDGRLAA